MVTLGMNSTKQLEAAAFLARPTDRMSLQHGRHSRLQPNGKSLQGFVAPGALLCIQLVTF